MKIRVHCVRAVRWTGDPGIKSRFGYNWFYFLPKMRWNGGVPWKGHIVDISLYWFCFLVYINSYPKSINDASNASLKSL